jgi:hypothetical protein
MELAGESIWSLHWPQGAGDWFPLGIERDTMMCDGIVVRLPDGESLCIPIIREKLLWKIPPDDPGPLSELIFDINTLAEISQGVSLIQDVQARRQLTEVLQNTVGELSKQLPESVSVGEEAFTYSG